MFISDKLRGFLLVTLVIVLFTNWYFYLDTYRLFQRLNGDLITTLKPILPQSIANNEKLIGEIIPKGISYVLLTALNICLSLTIIFVYFKDKRITLQGAKMMGIYFFVAFFAMNLFYFLGYQDYFMSARHALNLLATPLVECSMIPILKLANAEQFIKQK
ncbi:MAG: hypothetical protein ACJAWV_003176 [Flammeovirgaceae bacterium]|jgi:hypothetical protein